MVYLLCVTNGILCGLFNAARGSGRFWFFPRPFAMLYVITSSVVLSHADRLQVIADNPYQYAAAAGGAWLLLWLGMVFAWGAFFSAFHGRDKSHETTGFPYGLFGLFAALFQPEIKTEADARRWGVAGFTARSVLLYLPFAWLAYWNTCSLFFGLFVFSMGLIYGAMRYLPVTTLGFGRVRIAEFCYFMVVGYALAGAFRYV